MVIGQPSSTIDRTCSGLPSSSRTAHAHTLAAQRGVIRRQNFDLLGPGELGLFMEICVLQDRDVLLQRVTGDDGGVLVGHVLVM